MKAKSSKCRQKRQPSMMAVLEAVCAEIQAAGKALGFDVAEEGWFEKLHQESRGYDLPFDDKAHDRMLALMSPSVRGRVAALEQITYLVSGLLQNIEHENTASEIDTAMEGLRSDGASAGCRTLLELEGVA